MTLELLTIIITIGSVLIGAGVLFYYSLSLYDSSPEKERIGYVKYLEILKLDIIPGENTALIFEGERLRQFLMFRKLILIFMLLAIGSFAIRLFFL